MGKVGLIEREGGCRLVDMWNREVGALAPRVFFNRAAASLDLVLRLGIHRKLDKHRGCVNTVSFNENGNILASGSDDRMVILWDWEMGTAKLSFHSGHMNNVFQAKFMPLTNDQTMVTCAADGEVRIAELLNGGNAATRVLARHQGWAHKMAIEPGSPHILYSCGEDGLVHHIDLRAKSATKLFKCKSFRGRLDYMPIVSLHAITIDPRNPNRFGIAGSDEYARVYDIRKCRWDGKACGNPVDCFCPSHLIGDEQVGITGLAFSDQSELLASYNFDVIYLFPKDRGLGPSPDPAISNSIDRESVQVYAGHRNCVTVKGVSFYGPNCEYVTSGSDCGRVFIWRKKGGELLRVMEGDKHVVNGVEANPSVTMLATCGIETDIKIWMPNAQDPAAPVDFDEVSMQDSVSIFARNDALFYDDDDEDDDSYDDDDDDEDDILNGHDFIGLDSNDDDDDDDGA